VGDSKSRNSLSRRNKMASPATANYRLAGQVSLLDIDSWPSNADPRGRVHGYSSQDITQRAIDTIGKPPASGLGTRTDM